MIYTKSMLLTSTWTTKEGAKMATSQKVSKKTYVKPVLKASANLRLAATCSLATSPLELVGKCGGFN